MIKSRLTMFRENIRMSVRNILNNKMRTFLTILGIIIGVAAVIAMITTVSGVTGEITSQFADMGTGKFSVSVSGTELRPGLTKGDLAELEKIDNVTGISISMQNDTVARHGSEWTDEVIIEGRNTVYFRHNMKMVVRGRPVSILDETQRSRVCIISQGLQEKLFYGHDPIGQTMNLDGHTFTVIGVLSTENDNDVMTQAMGDNGKEKCIVPYTTAMQLSKTAYIKSIEIYVADTEKQDKTIDDVKETLTRIFNGRDDNDIFTVINMAILMDSLNTITSMMTTMLAGIAGISLLVGGIGIMNMMLVSVTERTIEIGLRKALGAEPNMIQMQFLIEAFILSTLGGAIGAVLGVSVSIMLCRAMDVTFVLSWNAIALGVGFSGLVGIVFGWAPARKASQLNPIDALRAS